MLAARLMIDTMPMMSPAATEQAIGHDVENAACTLASRQPHTYR